MGLDERLAGGWVMTQMDIDAVPPTMRRRDRGNGVIDGTRLDRSGIEP